MSGRKRLKERGLGSLARVKGEIQPTLGVNMTTITYRGVKYDAEQYKAKVLAEAAQARNHDLMYRGVKVQKKLTAV